MEKLQTPDAVPIAIAAISPSVISKMPPVFGGCLLGMARAIARGMAGVYEPEELEVWQLCSEIAIRMRPIVERSALDRWPDLRSQLDRTSESPAANIAEGFGRFNPRDNANFVRIALGSLAELPNHLSRARAHRVITPEEERQLRELAMRAKKLAKSYHRYLKTAKAPEIRPREKRRAQGIPRPTNPEPGTEP